MSDGGREVASLEVGVWKSSQKVNAERSAVRFIAWSGDSRCFNRSIFIREVLWLNIHKVRLEIAGKLHRSDRLVAEQCRLGNSMHTVHDASIQGEDNREAQVGGVDQTCVLHDGATCGGIASAAEPERLIELADEA